MYKKAEIINTGNVNLKPLVITSKKDLEKWLLSKGYVRAKGKADLQFSFDKVVEILLEYIRENKT